MLTLVLLAAGSSGLLLRRGLVVDVLLLGGALARSLLRGRGVDTLLTLLLLGGSSLLARSLLGSGWNRAIGRGGHELELDLGPGVASGTRIAHTGIGGEPLVVDLAGVSDITEEKGVNTYLWRTGLEGLHGPSEELKLALGELRRRAIGDGGVIVVGHVGFSGCAWMCWWSSCKEDAGERRTVDDEWKD